MYLDGLHQASDLPGMVRVHSVMGHLGMVLHPSPRRILVVGLGGGATPGAISRHPSSEITVVELSASVRRAARLFAHVNNFKSLPVGEPMADVEALRRPAD